MRLAPLLILLVARPCFADALTELRTTLQSLDGKDPVRAKISFSLWRENKDDKVVVDGRVAFSAEDGPEGLRVVYAPKQLAALRDEARAQVEDGEKPTPLKLATAEMSVPAVDELLGQAEPLLRSLATAKLVADKPEAYDGKPARLLEFEVAPILPPGLRKRVKKVQDHLKVWLGEDGVPVGTEEKVSFSGSIMLVGFEGTVSQTQKLAKVAGRLVVTQRASEDEASGFGSASHSRKSVTLTLP